jgi:hypothetical protein
VPVTTVTLPSPRSVPLPFAPIIVVLERRFVVQALIGSQAGRKGVGLAGVAGCSGLSNVSRLTPAQDLCHGCPTPTFVHLVQFSRSDGPLNTSHRWLTERLAEQINFSTLAIMRLSEPRTSGSQFRSVFQTTSWARRASGCRIPSRRVAHNANPGLRGHSPPTSPFPPPKTGPGRATGRHKNTSWKGEPRHGRYTAQLRISTRFVSP